VPDGTQGVVVFEERAVDFGEFFKDHRAIQKCFAHLRERADHVDAHRGSRRAVEHVGRLDRAVVGKGEGPVTTATATKL
jgi:hypothetical protein